MTDSVELLDRYRSAVISNHSGFTLLALLFRNGSATSHELESELRESPAEIAKLIKELYESDWIRIASAQRIFLSRKSEALLNDLDLSTIVTDSLTRDVLAERYLNDKATSAIAKRDSSFDQQNGIRRSLQIAYWTAKVFPDTESTIRKRVLDSVLSAREWQLPGSQTNVQSPTWESDLSWASHRGDDNRNLQFFFAEFKLPNNKDDRNVTARAAFQILVYVICFDKDFRFFRNILSHSHFVPARLWSELESDDQQMSQYFSAVASHFRPDIFPSMERAGVLQLVSSLYDRLRSLTSESGQGSSEQSSEPSITKLLTEKEFR